VELFPTKIRYTSMSLPYHIGNGWFGGMLPLLATAVVASTAHLRRLLVPDHRACDLSPRHASAEPRRPTSRKESAQVSPVEATTRWRAAAACRRTSRCRCG